MSKKNKPIKARNKLVMEVIYKSGAGVHGDTKHNEHKRNRQRNKQDLRGGKYDATSTLPVY